MFPLEFKSCLIAAYAFIACVWRHSFIIIANMY